MATIADAHDVTEPDTPDPVDGEPADSLEVRRRVVLPAVLTLVAGALTVGYVLRAADGGAPLDWAWAAVMALVALAYAGAVADARSPLVVVDRHGVRFRRGREWQGVAWPEVELVEHLPRRGLLRDGWLLVGRAHGADLTVPLSLSTRVLPAVDDVSALLDELAGDAVEVVEIDPALADEAEESDEVDGVDEVAEVADAHEADDEPVHEPVHEPTEAAPHERTDERPDAVDDVAAEDDRARPEPTVPLPAPVPLREARPAVRAEVRHDPRPETVGATALSLDTDATSGAGARLPEDAELRRQPDDDLTAVVLPAVDAAGTGDDEGHGDAQEPAPVADPVVGPQLAAARERLGLSVDQLADRTRIRPHVIESIEVDDFAPCGGDFYARGHLRTLCRVLAVDAAPVLAAYDETYADAPIDPRRVFEAELATGSRGTIRGTRGGPNWSVLVAAVMAVVLVWSIARLATGGSDPVTSPSPRLNGSAGLGNGAGALADPVPVVLTAAGGGARVIVRDGAGDIVYDGQLAFGQSATVDAAPPVRISSTDGSLTVGVAGQEAAPLGATGQQAQDTFEAP